MDKLWWRAAWGLCLVSLSLAQIDLNITCRYAGVYHVEKNGRYSISLTEAADLCKAFNSTLPTMEQMEKARSIGFETCRYGFIQGHVVIPRINPNSICAANNTGVYILTSNTSQYDTYCFNASAPADKEDCTSVTDLPNSFEGVITITIVNRDGTRYTKKGEYRTNPEDINPSNPNDDDVSSGSSIDRSTAGSNIFYMSFPTKDPTPDLTSPDSTDNAPTTSTDSNTRSAGPEPTEENEDERDKTPSFSGSGIDDDEDFISSTISTTPRLSHYTRHEDWNPWDSGLSRLQTTTPMTDVDRSDISAHGENSTQGSQPPLLHPEHHDDVESQPSTSTIQATPSSVTGETATQKEPWFGDGWPGEHSQTRKEDSHSTTGAPASAHDSHANQRGTTPSPEDSSSWMDFLDPISHPMGRGHQTERTTDVDSSHSTTLRPTEDPDSGLVDNLDREGPLSVTTQESHSRSFSTEHEGVEEAQDRPTAPAATSSTSNDDRGGTREENLPEDSATSVESYIPRSPEPEANRTLTSVTPAMTPPPGVDEVAVVGDSSSDVGNLLPEHREDGTVGRSQTTHGSESFGHSSGNQGDASTTEPPVRKAQIPEWLIILASLLALALILAVCIAVNSRRRCGQKKKLVINGNGAVENRKPSELNGEASKSQEMVHLVNKEPSETPDQCMTADETRNLQNVDMKIGV
ncbi:CD44 antigen isoform X2 [Tenrec ecaudatus]|uniref:CD44 antigen isoform X2 n=1 Tax=Tenrec ecaudatus TaxID=94439 RepID=UPI003F59FB50